MDEFLPKDMIVIPTFNERRNIEALIPRIFETVPNVLVTVVDDDSPDGTQDVVRELMKRYSGLSLYAHNQKAGFAAAYIDGFRKVLQEHPDLRSVTMMDADLSHGPEVLPEFYRQMETHDLVCGSRYIPGGSVVGWETWRKALSYMGNVYLRGVSRIPIKDITGGFNCIRASMLRNIRFDLVEARGYGFQYVLKHLLLKNGARSVEVPIVFRNRLEGESKLTGHIITEAITLPWKLRRHL